MLKNISPNKVFQYLLFTLIVIIILFILEYRNLHLYFPMLTLCIIGLVLIMMVFLIYRKLIINFKDNRKETRQGLSQIEPLFYLHKMINFRKPLPALRSFAASPDFLALMTDIVLEHEPVTIVEIGSGASTLINAYLLEQLGRGKVYSLDHEIEFGGQTQENIEKHSLSKYAEVILAPLKTYEIKNKKWKWYEVQELLEKVESIDLLIIDGPPERLQKNARYPALPLLIDKMSKKSIILVDDCARKEDRNTTKMWLNEFSEFSEKYYWLEKGAVLLKR